MKIGIYDLLKTSSPGKHIGELNFPRYPNNERLCIVRVMRHYLERTKDLRKTVTTLFIVTQKPHRGVSRDTIGRWMKSVMCGEGIDISIFKPHSTMTASFARKLPMATVRKTVGWKSDSVF